jgi:hypothetical protein
MVSNELHNYLGSQNCGNADGCCTDKIIHVFRQSHFCLLALFLVHQTFSQEQIIRSGHL